MKSSSLRKILSLSLCLVFLNGCAAAAVGSYAYFQGEKVQDKREVKKIHQEFLADFNATNIEREKNGLEPLDICEAKRQFDVKWAEEDETCVIPEEK